MKKFNKKQILPAALCVSAAALAVGGGTMAYFTDTDAAKNVMVTSNVHIVQNEQERGADGALQEFNDNKILYPVTEDTYDGYDGNIVTDGGVDKDGNEFPDRTSPVFDNSYNVLDKIVTVKNTGDSDAYVRTLFAFEVPVDAETGEWTDVVNVPPYLMTVYNLGLDNMNIEYLKDANGDWITIDIDGVKYLVGEYYYRNDSKLAPGEISHPSLKQIYMPAAATNEDAAFLVGPDGKYDILVLSQATQTAGFYAKYDDEGNEIQSAADVALDQAFGDVASVGVDKLVEWFSACQ